MQIENTPNAEPSTSANVPLRRADASLRSESPWAEASRLQDAKRDLAVWACRWQPVRERLLAEPRLLLEQQLGRELGSEVEVEVHEETEVLRFIVLPEWPAATPAEELVQGIIHAVARGVLHSESPLSASDRGIDETGVVGSDPELDIVARAWGDEEFRQQLREQPSEALSRVGIQWPACVRLELLEEAAECLHVVIPRQVSDRGLASASFELPRVADSETESGSASSME